MMILIEAEDILGLLGLNSLSTVGFQPYQLLAKIFEGPLITTGQLRYPILQTNHGTFPGTSRKADTAPY
jgi:hypothetical protein